MNTILVIEGQAYELDATQNGEGERTGTLYRVASTGARLSAPVDAEASKTFLPAALKYAEGGARFALVETAPADRDTFERWINTCSNCGGEVRYPSIPGREMAVLCPAGDWVHVRGA